MLESASLQIINELYRLADEMRTAGAAFDEIRARLIQWGADPRAARLIMDDVCRESRLRTRHQLAYVSGCSSLGSGTLFLMWSAAIYIGNRLTGKAAGEDLVRLYLFTSLGCLFMLFGAWRLLAARRLRTFEKSRAMRICDFAKEPWVHRVNWPNRAETFAAWSALEQWMAKPNGEQEHSAAPSAEG